MGNLKFKSNSSFTFRTDRIGMCVCVCVCVCMHACMHALLVLSDSSNQWIIACQAPLSMEFYRKENWRVLPFQE